VLVAILSLIPGHWQRRTGLPGPIEHLIAYFGTGAVLAIALPQRWTPWLAAAALFAYACLLEVLQNFSPGRDPRLIDAVVSGAGALGGTLTMWAIAKGLDA
jgi:VanZ family protein